MLNKFRMSISLLLVIISVTSILFYDSLNVFADSSSDFQITNGVLTKYTGSGGDVVIPNSVTSIGNNAFEYCTNITSINIPNSVTKIGDWVFDGCSNIKNIIIPNSVIYIGDMAFTCCRNLSEVVISNSVTSIGNGAFDGCSKLTSMYIPSSVTNIGDGVFSDCSSLTDIRVDLNNKNYLSENNVIFNKNKSILVQFPGGNISNSYVIPNSVTSIQGRAFNCCFNLNSITIPDSITNIGEGTFMGCTSLTNIAIPNSVTNIGESSFAFCIKMTDINVEPNNQYYSSKNGILFNKNMSTLIQYPAGNTGISYTIPNSVTNVGNSAFADSNNLIRININKCVINIGENAFGCCYKLSLYGDASSYAENYAINNNIPFICNRSCDVNKDGLINIGDIAAEAKLYNSQKGDIAFNDSLDINNDGIIDIYDLVLISNEIQN